MPPRLCLFCQNTGTTLLPHPPYSIDLPNCDFSLFSERMCRLVHSRLEYVDQKVHRRLNDEAHFWLNGFVNKQNFRIWREANPQVYVETPFHPEKLTVWCALWAGGIFLQKR
ncbi:hypothetical protein TNCV_951981 [Trichonephila clavipes]|nr:hypothetical protein TNCV_951981 [Trichonephila clavipes]